MDHIHRTRVVTSGRSAGRNDRTSGGGVDGRTRIAAALLVCCGKGRPDGLPFLFAGLLVSCSAAGCAVPDGRLRRVIRSFYGEPMKLFCAATLALLCSLA